MGCRPTLVCKSDVRIRILRCAACWYGTFDDSITMTLCNAEMIHVVLPLESCRAPNMHSNCGCRPHTMHSCCPSFDPVYSMTSQSERRSTGPELDPPLDTALRVGNGAAARVRSSFSIFQLSIAKSHRNAPHVRTFDHFTRSAPK